MVDDAKVPAFVCKHGCGGKYGHAWDCPVLMNFDVAMAEARGRGDKLMWWNFEVVKVTTDG